ncbi:MAG: ABC transporter ATP-binding protein [Patescibacteria group bacterium]|mgnify:CR=1 FL=1
MAASKSTQFVDTYSNWDLIRDLWRWLGKYRARFLAASFILLLSEISWLYPTYALAKIVTLLSASGVQASQEQLSLLVVAWIGLSIFHYVSQQIAKYIGYQIGERLALDVEMIAVGHMLKLDLAWQERENAGNKIKKIQRGSNFVEMLLDLWIDSLLPGIVRFVGALTIIGAVDGLIGSWMVVFLVSYFVLSEFMTKRATTTVDAVNQAEENVGGLEFEAVNNIRTVKVLGFGGSIMSRMQQLNSTLFEKIQIRIQRFRTRDLVIHSWGQLFRIGLLIYVIRNILNGTYEAGFLILVYGYFTEIWASLGRIADQTIRLEVARLSIARLVQILHEPIGIEARGEKSFPKHWQSISFKDVSFSYGDDKVLKRLSFTIKRGEKLGVVGLSGAGKSTLFKLLLKEYEDYTGEILVDKTPLREIKRSSFVEHTAVVLQDTEVFNFSLKENVTIANSKKARDGKLFEQALQIAHVTDFMGRLPKGDQTLIGEKGVKLSGGEKQRVGIARAVFKQPDLLLLDEATSHLDSESEQKIQDSLHHVFKSVTAVVIAHRLSTIREMDCILVLEGGKLIEEGSFDELLKKKGRFAQLWKTQQF